MQQLTISHRAFAKIMSEAIEKANGDFILIQRLNDYIKTGRVDRRGISRANRVLFDDLCSKVEKAQIRSAKARSRAQRAKTATATPLSSQQTDKAKNGSPKAKPPKMPTQIYSAPCTSPFTSISPSSHNPKKRHRNGPRTCPGL